MTKFQNRLLQTFVDAQGVENTSCDVELKGNRIRVECPPYYHRIYKGEDVGNGHYNLFSRRGEKGKATLHISSSLKPLVLEGYWKEGNRYGMWRILLNEEYSS